MCPNSTETQALLARAANGDDLAFAQLIEPEQRKLWSVCFRITNNSHDAEDALQECLVAAWHNLGSFRGDAQFGTWLYRIAANASLSVVRRRGKATVSEEIELSTPEIGEQVAVGITVREALAKLPPVFREAVVLRELCDFSYEQIAAHQGCPVQTVKSRISRGRALLRTELQR